MHYPTYSMVILPSTAHPLEVGSEIFLNKFTSFSIKGFLKTTVSIAGKIKNHFSVLEQL